MPTHIVTGVELDSAGQVVRVRWYLADIPVSSADGGMPHPLTAESVVDTLEVVDKLLDAEAVIPLFRGPDGARLGAAVKVHVQEDGTEFIEVDPSLPGQRLRDLPHL